MATDALGLAAVLALVALLVAAVLRSGLSRGLKVVLVAALGLRVVGSVLRYRILFDFYGGSGDALGYYGRGLELADRLRALDLGGYLHELTSSTHGLLGTGFISIPSSLVLFFVGPNMLAGFLVFSLLAFLGLLCFVEAFRRAFPKVPLGGYAALVLLFPSLWYWPSSMGKEALIFLGMGLTALGYVGRGGRRTWALLVPGVVLVVLVRPELGAVLGLGLALAQVLRLRQAASFGRVASILVLSVGALGLFTWAGGVVGIPSYEPDAVLGFVETHPTRQIDRGTLVDAPQLGVLGVPLAFANVLVRPLVWEATNPMVLASALELLLLWAIVWKRRASLRRTLREWRSSSLVQLVIALALVYTVALGLLVVNAGIIARQRTILLPFLFILLSGPAACSERLRPVAGRVGAMLRAVGNRRRVTLADSRVGLRRANVTGRFVD